MNQPSPAEIKAMRARYSPVVDKPKFTVYGAYNNTICACEGSYALCKWYRDTYNKKLTIKGIR